MVVSRCRGIGPPSSGIVLGTQFLLAAEGILGIPLPALLSNIYNIYICPPVPVARAAPVIPLPALLSNIYNIYICPPVPVARAAPVRGDM